MYRQQAELGTSLLVPVVKDSPGMNTVVENITTNNYQMKKSYNWNGGW
jgi:hypothetical protein